MLFVHSYKTFTFLFTGYNVYYVSAMKNTTIKELNR